MEEIPQYDPAKVLPEGNRIYTREQEAKMTVDKRNRIGSEDPPMHKRQFAPAQETTAVDIDASSFMHKGVAQEAHQIIHGARRKSYGPVEQSFQEIAKLIQLLLPHLGDVTPHDVSMIMICVKLIREKASHSRDNLVDLCGYADLREQLFVALGEPNGTKEKA